MTVDGNVTLDASGSTNATSASFDVDGDGTYEVNDSTDLVVEVSYDQPGTYEPTVRVSDDSDDANGTDTATCGTVSVVRNQPPDSQLLVEPETAAVGEQVTLDASGSSDPDGTIVAYNFDADGDGTVEWNGTEPTVEHVYDTAGTYNASVTVEDEDGGTTTATETIVIESPAPTAACEVTPASVSIGDAVTIDATGSTNANVVAIDVDGDGIDDRTLESSFQATITYNESGTFEPAVTARNDVGEDRVDCPAIEVLGTASDENAIGNGAENATNGSSSEDGGVLAAIVGLVDGDGGPGSPQHAGGTVLLLGAVGWVLARAQRASDDPRPRGVFEWRSDLEERFAAGRLDPGDETRIVADVGFEPDLVLLTADSSGDEDGRSSTGDRGLSNGIALHTSDGIVQHAVGARSGTNRVDPVDGDGSAVVTADGAGIVFAADDRGTLRGRVTETSDDGFVLECDAALDAPVLYRAITFPADVDVTVGTDAVAEGTETVTLPDTGPLDALLVDAVGEDAGSDAPSQVPERGWCVGTAVSDGTGQSVSGVGTSGASVASDGVLELGIDGPRARLDRLRTDPDGTGRLPTLSYDEPAQFDHTLQFVALAGVPTLGPATGAFDVSGEAGTDAADPLESSRSRAAASGDQHGDTQRDAWTNDAPRAATSGGSSERQRSVSFGFEPTCLEYWAVRGDGSEPGSVTVGVALAEQDGLEQWTIGDEPREPGAQSVRVGTFAEDGATFTVSDDSVGGSERTTITYRAWPGPLGREDGGGGRS